MTAPRFEQEDALRKLAEKATRPKPKTYPAHGSGIISFYAIAETDAYIDSLLDELSALRAELPEAVKVSEPLTEEKLRSIANPPPKTVPWISGKVGMSMAAELLALRAEKDQDGKRVSRVDWLLRNDQTKQAMDFSSHEAARSWARDLANAGARGVTVTEYSTLSVVVVSPAQPEGQDQ